MSGLSRRRFLENSAALLAATALPQELLALDTRSSGRRIGPNDKLRVAVIGVNGRGMEHVRAYAHMDDCVVAAICDADTAVMGKAVQAVVKAGQPEPKTYQDVRKLLEEKSIDAVSIATPNHWHALAAIWAMQAGKDVYVEKPVSQNVSEGRRIVEVARKLNRICQAGTQSRSSKGLREAMAYLHSGKLGKVTLARGLCYKPRPSIGKVDGPTPVPTTVDYDLWLGPAPKKDVMRRRFHYDWHWFWDYGSGDLGNQGIHEMDKARWGLNRSGMPQRVVSVGGRFGYVDDGETPNTMISVYDYGDAQLIFEVRGLKTSDLKGARVGNIFYGSKGYMVVPSYSSAVVFDHDGNKIEEFKAGGDHFRNFVDAVKSRSRTSLHGEIEEGHVSSALCHLGNVSYRLGSRQPLNKKTGAFGDNKEAYETLARFEQHLSENDVKLDTTEYTVGRSLKVDARHESFGSDQEANALLTRAYRSGFEVPARA